MNDKYSISYFDRIDNPGGAKRATLTREKLFDAITRIRPHKKKKDFPAWSPCIFNGRANNKNAIEVSCLVWDIDAGLFTFEDMRSHLQQTQYNCFMHTTYSHTDKQHKYRVIFPLKTPIVAEDWRYAWIGSLLFFRFMRLSYIDRACRDARRLYYLGGYSFGPYMTYSQLDREDWDAEEIAYEVFLREEAERIKRKERLEREFREYMSIQQKKKEFHRDWNSEQREKLRSTHSERKHFAGLLSGFGAQIVYGERKKTGERVARVVGFPCPRCRRSDCTYFYLDPSIMSAAYCEHRDSCQWFGSLYDLGKHFGIGR